MSNVSRQVLSNAPNVTEERKRIRELLIKISGKKNPHFLLGFSNGKWNFKCFSSLLNLSDNSKFFSLKNRSIDNIKEVIQKTQEG